MAEDADVVVVGLGTSGEDVALRLLGAGLDVVGIEPHLVGGECPYWACLPTKSLIRSAGLLQEARRADGLVGRVTVTPDWSVVAARLRAEITGGWDDSTAVTRFESRGGRFVRGFGRVVGPRTVAVGDRTFVARRGVVLATGSRQTIPPIPGLEKTGYWTTHDAVAAEVLPRSLIVLGGGAVGCELGQVFARFGVDVTIVEAADRLLPAEEPVASEALMAAFADEGITVRSGVSVVSTRTADGSVAVTLADGTELTGERLLVATGRTANLPEGDLDATGLDVSTGYVAVDERLRAADGVWAMGDVTGKGMTTHVALYQGSIVVTDILGHEPRPADYRAVPRVCFTDPEVASVGLTEAAARDAGLDVDIAVKQVPATFRGWLHRTGNGGLFKLVVDRTAGTLVGATAVGPHAAEVLGMLSTAVHGRVPVADLVHMIYPFPTFFGGVGEALGAYGRGLVTVLDPATPPMFVDPPPTWTRDLSQS
jgi:pyruvate/2-oxoglutarate dehydrogenase complex dihydrolipoamide dehydrogenase (E3) component